MDKKIGAAVAIVCIILVAAVGIYFVSNNTEGSEKGIESAYSKAECNLWVYGNANGDNYIDENDVNLLKRIISGEASEIEVAVYDGYNASNAVTKISFADANQDGTIDEKDIAYVEKIIAYQKNYSKAVSDGTLASFNDELDLYYNNCDNQTAVVHLPIKSLISMYFSNSEIVRLLNAVDRVVATDSTTIAKPTLLPEFQGIINLGDRKNVNSEAVLATHADAYFTGSASTYSPYLEKSCGNQIDIIRLSAWEDNNVMVGALTLGYMLGCTEKAYEYIDWCNYYIDLIDKKISNLSDKTTVIVPKGRGTCLEGNGAGSGQFEITLLAGADNLAAGIKASSEYPDFTQEDMLKSNPQYIILSGYCGFEAEGQVKEKVYDIIDSACETYKGTSAVSNGHVYFIANEIFTGPSNIVSLAYCAQWLYPELFEDLDGTQVFQEYLDTFCPSLEGYSLNEHLAQFIYGPGDSK